MNTMQPRVQAEHALGHERHGRAWRLSRASAELREAERLVPGLARS